jgi:hypothetical protein
MEAVSYRLSKMSYLFMEAMSYEQLSSVLRAVV